MNSFSLGMYRKIQQLLTDANVNPNVKCIIIKGEGKMFCAGNDLGNFMIFPPELMDVNTFSINLRHKETKKKQVT